MRRVPAALAAALAVAATCGPARGDTYAVVGTASPAPLVLPSPEMPNVPGSLRLPPGWTERAGVVRTLSFVELQALWARAGAAYGVPWEVLAAINKIESNFGRNMGPSSAGAVGWMQFMPETWLRWGTDGNADGVADPWNPEDAVYSAARYLAATGARADLPQAVFAYNHADWYVRDVLLLARTFAGSGTALAFSLDRLHVDLEEAERAVAQANEELVAALRQERTLGRSERRLLVRADGAELLSAELALRKKATLVGVRREGVRRRLEALRAGLAEAERELAAARASASAASFSPAGGGLLAGPVSAGGFVFPVGGGAAVVSAPHGHHDYPAVDIAAPAGAPVYAHADVLVEKAWSYPDARCGIGATLRTADGRGWTYCHLSYLDPGIQVGRILVAGTPVGLVGSTGHSTGPHLHLQLQPPTSFPQAEPWFQAFFGTAFRWQDDEAPRALPAAPPYPRREPVFAVVVPEDADGRVVQFESLGG